jgi:CHAT domain-containing protein
MTNVSQTYQASYDTAQQCLTRYTTSTAVTDIISGIRHAREAVAQCQQHSQAWVDAMCLLTVFLWMRFITDPSDDHLEQGIEHVKQTMVGVAAGNDGGPLFTLASSELHMNRYQRQKDLKDVELALCFTPETEPIYETRLNILADGLYQQYKTTRVRDTLLHAITVRRQVLDIPTINESLRCKILGNLGLMLSEDFKLVPEIQIINAAIDYIRRAVEISRANDEDDPKIYTQLGKSLTLKYSVSRELDDIKEACDQLDNGINATPEGDPLLIYRMNDKLAALEARSTYTGDVEIFREACDLADNNLRLAEANADAYAIIACNLANMYQKRYHQDGDGEHLETALKYMAEADNKASPTSEHYSELCAIHSLVLLTKYKHTQHGDALDAAMQRIEAAIRTELGGAMATAEHNHIRGMILAERAALSGRLADFETAIAEEETSLNAQSLNSPSKADTLFKLCSLGLARFRIRPEPRIIQSSIEYGLRCLSIRGGGPRRETEVFNVLSNAYFARFEVERGKADIDEGIRIGIRSIRDDSDPHQAEYLTNLASKFRSRAIRYGVVTDIDDALLYIRQASDLQTAVPRTAFFVLGTMTLISLDWCRLHKSVENLPEAIKVGEQSLPLSSTPDGSRSDTLIHLGNMQHEKYKYTKASEALQAAIEYGYQAVKDCPAQHYKKAMILDRLGSWLQESFEKEGRDEDKAQAKAVFRQALGVENAPPIFRVQSGRAAARLHTIDCEWQPAYECLGQVVALFPRISPRAFSREDQQFALSQLTGLAAVAASCALNAGKDAGEALQVLESGRGIISSWHISTRSDVSDLQQSHPGLAKKYLDLRKQLSQAAKVLNSPRTLTAVSPIASNLPLDVSHVNHTEMHRNVAVELGEVEDEIRSKEGFGHFQKPLTAADFIALAQTAPIVVVNVTQLRSDAFLITSAGVRAINLPEFSQVELLTKLESLFGSQNVTVGLPSTRSERNVRLRDCLGWLWDHAVQTILTNLNLIDKSASQLKRLFWLTTGFASFYPFHAAGHYRNRSTGNAPSHIVSTYITSFRALRYSREQKSFPLSTSHSAPLVIAMDKTIGQIDLSASVEAQAIKESFKSIASLFPDVKHHPSREEVLVQMHDRQIVHFACHGYADRVDPSNSRLLLRDALVPGVPDTLSVYDIVTASNNSARLAYLSACSTAENAVTELLDENIHIAGTFQLIGFPNVIGTLWSVSDRAAVATAGSFYTHLLSKGNENDDMIAFALHEAVRELRETKIPGSRINPAEDVLAWAPFVHFGA